MRCECCNEEKQTWEYRHENVCLDCVPYEHILKYQKAEIEKLKECKDSYKYWCEKHIETIKLKDKALELACFDIFKEAKEVDKYGAITNNMIKQFVNHFIKQAKKQNRRLRDE